MMVSLKKKMEKMKKCFLDYTLINILVYNLFYNIRVEMCVGKLMCNQRVRYHLIALNPAVWVWADVG